MIAQHGFGPRVWRGFSDSGGDVFAPCFRQWLAGIVGTAEGVVAFGGKTVKRSQDEPNTALQCVRFPCGTLLFAYFGILVVLVIF